MSKYVLYGAGNYGKRIIRMLRDEASYFCDNNISEGTIVEGVKVISPETLKQIKDDHSVLITVADSNSVEEIAQFLNKEKISFMTLDQAIEKGCIDREELKLESELDYWRNRYVAEEGQFTNLHYKKLMLSIAGEEDDSFLRDKVVIDFGCGPRGSLTWMTAPMTKIGVDVLASRYAEQFGDNLIKHDMVYVTSSENCIPIPDGYSDCVITINSLDHVRDLDKMCSELLRILKPGGILLGSFNLNEPKTECEPQTLTESLLEDKLLSFFDISSYRIALQGEKNEQFINMYNRNYAEGSDKAKPCYLWVRGIKK